MNALRPALRIARREVWRRKGRTLLVVLLVAVPVAAVLAGTSVARTVNAPADILARREVGGADAAWSTSGAQTRLEAGASAAAEQFTTRVAQSAPEVSTATIRSASGTIAAPGGETSMTVVAGPMAGPLVSPRYDLIDGHLPARDGEVALTSTLAEALGAGVGTTIEIPELGMRGDVVGIAERVLSSGARELLTTQLPDLEPGTVEEEVLIDLPGGAERQALEQVGAVGQEFGGQYVRVASTFAGASGLPGVYVMGPMDGLDSAVRWTFVGEVLAFAVLGLLISVAFTIGARRQVRMLGLVAASGGSPRMVRAVVVAQGFWCGVVGAVLGLVLTIVGLTIAWPIAAPYLAYQPGWWTVSVVDALVIGLIGVGAAVASSWWPARTVSRQSVLQALAGRRPLPSLRPRLAVAGAVIAGGGLGLLALTTVLAATPRSSRGTAVLSALAIAGGLAMLAGTVIGAHGFVAFVGRLGSRAGGSVRLATRSLARQRTRYGSVVAGVAALTAGVLLIAGSTEPGRVRYSQNPPIDVYRAPDNQVTVSLRQPVAARSLGAEHVAALAPVTDVLPGASLVPLQSFRLALDYGGGQSAWSNSRPSAVATPELIGQLDLPQPVRDALADGGAIGFAEPGATSSGQWDPQSNRVVETPLAGVRTYASGDLGPPIDVTWFTPDEAGPSAQSFRHLGPTFLVTPERLAALGIPEPAIDVVQVVSPTALTDGQRDALEMLMPGKDRFWLRGQPNPSDATFQLTVPTPLDSFSDSRPRFDSGRLVEVAVGLASLLLTAFVVALGVALAAADNREERDALDALGAPAVLMRRTEGLKAAIVAALGAAIALVAAGVPAAVIALAYRYSQLDRVPSVVVGNDDEWWRFVPWSTVVWVLIGVPLVIGLCTTAGSGLRARWRPVRASQFSFD